MARNRQDDQVLRPAGPDGLSIWLRLPADAWGASKPSEPGHHLIGRQAISISTVVSYPPQYED
jgi:hypothetical protein